MDLFIHFMKATPVFSSENFVIKSHILRTCSDSLTDTVCDSFDSIMSINPNSDPSTILDGITTNI
jgi:hypothetical protein